MIGKAARGRFFREHYEILESCCRVYLKRPDSKRSYKITMKSNHEDTKTQRTRKEEIRNPLCSLCLSVFVVRFHCNFITPFEIRSFQIHSTTTF